jgi:hypothetical protein
MRLYICHTYYHVYVSILKEISRREDSGGAGDIMLSTLSTDFQDLDSRLRISGFFSAVSVLPERNPNKFIEKFKYARSGCNWLQKLYIRRKYYQYVVRNEEPYLKADYKKYDEIYVFCDSDPIGYYLNAKRIRYISVEDGNNAGSYNSVIIDNQRFFWLKRFLAKRNFLFMQDGYARYCKGYEVNCAKGVFVAGRKIIECAREQLTESLSDAQRQSLYQLFACRERPKKTQPRGETILLLTQPLCTEENRVRLYKKIIKQFASEYDVIIKPHPIDKVDYRVAFPDCLVLESVFPIEIFNIHCEYNIRKIVTVCSTSLDTLKFADEKIFLGVEMLDEFEEPEKHSDLLKRGCIR